MIFSAGMFPGRSPWHVVFDVLSVSHSQFWLVSGSMPGSPIVCPVPEGDSMKGNGEAVGVPTLASATRVDVVLSAWEREAPEGHGTPLGTCRIWVPGRELVLVNVEGREPGPVLVLPDAEEFQVRGWRCPASDGHGPERYDLRVGPVPALE
ncbi:hypothetical protein [Streptomyces sp. NPDC093795]|uniref:hypothetical protein n=1 Tax=Streptomyces sp. NPDC093795 TaxID=3366051 RepID=UPI0038161E90